jgi:hypothetical protein
LPRGSFADPWPGRAITLVPAGYALASEFAVICSNFAVKIVSGYGWPGFSCLAGLVTRRYFPGFQRLYANSI